MRLRVEFDEGLYRIWVDATDGGSRALLRPGDVPSWAGGWAGVDGVGGYDREGAALALAALGLGTQTACGVLDRARAKGPAPVMQGRVGDRRPQA